jgi:hypothetical protein
VGKYVAEGLMEEEYMLWQDQYDGNQEEQVMDENGMRTKRLGSEKKLMKKRMKTEWMLGRRKMGRNNWMMRR